jgi:hypothetical protein
LPVSSPPEPKSLPDYDENAAALLMERVLSFLDNIE